MLFLSTLLIEKVEIILKNWVFSIDKFHVIMYNNNKDKGRTLSTNRLLKFRARKGAYEA